MFNQFEGRSIDDVIKGTVHTAHSQEFVALFILSHVRHLKM